MWRNTEDPGQREPYKTATIAVARGRAVLPDPGAGRSGRLSGARRVSWGGRFDIRGFHGTVLGSGAGALSGPRQLVAAWTEQQAAG